MKSPTRSIPAALTLSLALSLAACSEPVATATKPCPCASGYVCCSSGVCAPDQPSCGVATAALSAEAQGHWTGYVEGSATPLVSDALDIRLSVDADGTLRGQVQIGDGPPPPPPTAAREAWPPAGHFPTRSGVEAYHSLLLIDGATYTAENVKWQARRLRFDVRVTEPMKPWCMLQTVWPQNGTPPGFTCLPPAATYGRNEAGGPNCLVGEVLGGDATEPADCNWLNLCGSGWCVCTAAGCSNNTIDSSSLLSFDIAIRGDEADGTLGESNLRLVRASH